MIEVFKQMVEALEWCHGGEPIGTAEAIKAGKQAIAELESQKQFEDLATELFVVAQVSPADNGFSETIERIESWLREHFTYPPQRTEQEPVAWYCCFQGQEEGEFFLFGSPNSERYPSQYKTPLYEHLPQRTWVELTDEDRQAAFESMPDMLDGFLKKWGWLHFSKAIEAKLKEKNHG